MGHTLSGAEGGSKRKIGYKVKAKLEDFYVSIHLNLGRVQATEIYTYGGKE